MNFFFIEESARCNSTEILFFADHVKLNTFMTKNKLSYTNAGTKIVENGRHFVFFLLNMDNPFTSIRECADKIASFKEDICLNLCQVPDNIKFVLCQYIVKYRYVFNKYKTNTANYDIYFKDKAKNKNDIYNFTNQVECANIARDLQNEPANKLDPNKFCHKIKTLFSKDKNVQIKIFNERQIKSMGMGLIDAIGKSSNNPPRLLVIEYIKNKNLPNLCIVGKSVCYDAGGYNMKTKSMKWDMKGDMSGGACTCSIIKYFSKHHYTIGFNIIGILPIVENLVSGDASKPGDIHTAYNGQTVELLNTDAEGRYIMADALAYSINYKPRYVIDIATLTGYSQTVHNDISANIFSSNESLVSRVRKIGEMVGERVWMYPMWTEYMKQIQSNVANIKNQSGTKSDAYYACLFLYNFVPNCVKNNFLHFDIANNEHNHYMVGNCISLIIELVKDLAKRKTNGTLKKA